MAAAGIRQSSFSIAQVDECWKERVRIENRINRYAWPYAWGFTVGEYYQLDDELSGGKMPAKPRPPPIKPLDLDAPLTDRGDGAGETAAARRRGAYPKTSSAVVGWAQLLTPVDQLRRIQQLERHARQTGDIRKTFGWPPDGD